MAALKIIVLLIVGCYAIIADMIFIASSHCIDNDTYHNHTLSHYQEKHNLSVRTYMWPIAKVEICVLESVQIGFEKSGTKYVCYVMDDIMVNLIKDECNHAVLCFPECRQYML